MDIREGAPPATDKIYAAAFPEEDLVPLVRELIREPVAIGFAATESGVLVGHAFFTLCGLDNGLAGEIALLGPIAVSPARQRAGIGGALIRHGFDAMTRRGARAVMVLGDPAYYGRFGFEPESGVAPPYALPDEWAGAWRMRVLDGGLSPRGVLSVPPSWRDPALWGP